ncbi:hypothetical protein KKC88_04385 [Patescibacteria group bacterium]|nr:hypothetical protein [Patescibacteria group bacterium]MBU1673970.1 hypothetical protein [Patescibacteria group bacterium]MBU1962956.1 hypothetical protein [Patescibacteria group bacterium]
MTEKEFTTFLSLISHLDDLKALNDAFRFLYEYIDADEPYEGSREIWDVGGQIDHGFALDRSTCGPNPSKKIIKGLQEDLKNFAVMVWEAKKENGEFMFRDTLSFDVLQRDLGDFLEQDKPREIYGKNR